MRCRPCALHVYSYTTEKGNHTKTAKDARERRDCTFPDWDTVFWKAVIKIDELPRTPKADAGQRTLKSRM